MKKFLLSFMLIAGIYGLAFGQQSSQGQASANDPNWEKIGEKTVDLSTDSGIFNWNTDREKTVNANEKYSAIKFKAKDATVNLTDVQVEYDDGRKQDLSINSPVQANSESKVVTLNSQAELDKITFNFKKDDTAREDKATIEVWGLKARSGSGMGQRDTDSDRQTGTQSGSDRSGTGQGTQSGRTGTGTQSGTDRSGQGTDNPNQSSGSDQRNR